MVFKQIFYPPPICIMFSLLVLYILLSYNTSHPPFSASSPLQKPLPQIHHSLCSLQKRVGLPVFSTGIWHKKMQLGQARHKSSYQGWTKQSGRRKRVKSTHKKVMSLLRVPQNPELNNNNIFSQNLEETYAGSMTIDSVSVSPYMLCFYNSVGHVLVVVLILLPRTIISHSIEGSSKPHLMFGCRSAYLLS